jgi:CHAT domain-containing protein/tetratricopeptide (TPR) repeat protein
MANSERLAALIAAYRSLDPEKDTAKLRPIMAEAATLVDPTLQPKKWAAFRTMFARFASQDEPRAALAAYLDALSVWTPEEDRDNWVHCHGEVGLLLMRLYPLGAPECDAAINHFELVVSDQPFFAEALGTLYRYRLVGDPAANWKHRMKYLRLALSQVSPVDNASGWIRVQNEIGIACTDQPSVDFAEAVEKRMACHIAALTALSGLPQSPLWIDTCLNLSEAYLFRVLGDKEDNHRQAEEYLRQAVAACNEQTDPDLRRKAYISLGRILVKRNGTETVSGLHEALTYFEKAIQLIDVQNKPELGANVEAFRVNAYRTLISLGEKQWVEPLIAGTEAALRGFDPNTHPHERRSVLQVESEGLLEAGEFAKANAALEKAIEAGEAALAQATSTEGRLERVFQLADSSALLSYCYLELEQTWKALQSLDRGKARFWHAGADPKALDGLGALIPSGGAALFPVLSWRKGAVIVVTRKEEGLRCEPVWLPKFSKPRLVQLQRGDPGWKDLGGWLKAYSYHRSEPEAWVREINAMGGILYDEVWAPVLEKLNEMNITAGAELIWFPQGGSGVLPMHAAWKEENGNRRWLIQDYAIRYAPSVQSLQAQSPGGQQNGRPVIISNPGGDLAYGDLECAWVEKSLGASGVLVFRRELATKEAVLPALLGSTLAHFATHATFDLKNPFDSSIHLAANQHVRLGEMLHLLKGNPPGVVVLSACESGMARVTSTPDEFLGFPPAFLELGTRTVLATLWPVDDAGTSVIVQRFYKEYRGEVTAAEALRRTQQWALIVTVEELFDLVGELQDEPAPVGPFASQVCSQLFGADQKDRPLAEPYFWAAFTVSGQ